MAGFQARNPALILYVQKVLADSNNSKKIVVIIIKCTFVLLLM